MTGGRRTQRPSSPGWGLELALVLVGVVVALGFARLFEGSDFVRPLLSFVLGAHALAIASRRARVPGPLVVVLAVAGSALAVTWILFPETTRWLLPTHATWEAARDALADARERYPEVVAPTEAVPGFLLAAGVALWIAAWFADWTAHRLRAGAEAVAPATAVFTFCAVLGSGSYEVASAVAFAGSVLLFLGLQRAATLAREQAWSPDHRAASRSLARSAAAVAAVAVLAGAVVGPGLPGAGSEAAIDWRGDGAGNRTRVTVSPMVELKRRLVDQSDIEVFRVTSSQRAYWRLTSLDRFDGEIWSSNGDYRPAEADLPTEAPEGTEGDLVTQAVEIDGLAAIWVPAAFEAVSVRSSDEALRWDEGSSTLIVDSEQPSSDGLSYTVVSRAPTFDPEALAAAGDVDPQEIVERYEPLPAGFPEFAADEATRATSGADSRYAKALALQSYFRTNFEYSLEVPAGHGDDALVDFLEGGVGYCEQFAGAYAAMARSLGIPARVAVGFTPGEQDPRASDVFVVRGRHAHAWPEVYFPELGWVPFEPTPGRGIPGAQPYTGVPAEQDDATGGTITIQSTTTTTPPTTAGDRPGTTVPRSGDEPDRTVTAPSPRGANDDGGRTPLAAVALAAAAIGAVVLLVRWRRAAAGGRRPDPLGPADAAWRTVAQRLAAAGLAASPAETPLEHAARAGAERPDLADDLTVLARWVTEERWSTDVADDGANEARAAEVATRLDAVVEALGRGRPVPAPA